MASLIIRSLLVTSLTVLFLEIKFENLVLFFYSVQCSTVALETTFDILRFSTGVYVDIRPQSGKNATTLYWTKYKTSFIKLWNSRHYPFGWTFSSMYRNLTIYFHSIKCSFISHAHYTFFHSMMNMVLYCLALLQTGLLEDVSQLMTLTFWNKTFSLTWKKNKSYMHAHIHTLKNSPI